MALVPVFQASKRITSGAWTGTDYDYPVGIDAARASQNAGYSIDCVAFVAEDTPTAGYRPFLRYMQNGFHFYTTDTTGEGLNGWTATPAAKTAYLLAPTATPPAGSGMVPLARYVNPPTQTGVAHFFCASTSVTPVPAGWIAEDPTHAHTGWVAKPARVDFTVDYNGNGQSSGITVTGGNATGQTVTIDGQSYVMQADDALVGFGVGNWVGFQRKEPSTVAWHFQDIVVVKGNPNTPDSLARFDKLLSVDEKQVAVVDDDEDNSTTEYAYKYTLKIVDEGRDLTVEFDPKIINRAPAVTN